MRIASSLSNRIFLACTLIAAVPLGLTFYVVNARAEVEVDAELRRRLTEDAGIATDRRRTVTETFATFARLIADLPKLKAAVETGDPPTVQPLADEYRREIDADVLILTSPEGRLLGASGVEAHVPHGDEQPFDPVSPEIDPEMTLVRHPRGLLQTVRVPILLAGEPAHLLGHLTVGFFFDDQLATQFKRVTGGEIAFVAGGAVVSASLPASVRGPLAALASTSGITPVVLGNETFLAASQPLDAAPAATTGAPALLILRSQTGPLRLFNTIRLGLAGALVVALLLATVLSFGVARTMTRPLAAVTRAMGDVAATGDLTRKVLVRSAAWDDEDARLLGTAFNRLTESVAQFQRDAAQRERLSSLGRLSTVIAHEIRNPLMIVRASLSALRREGATAAEIREAVADIDEETRRLNRIVTEVLDFARPLRFDYAEADVNAICRASVAAAWTGDTAGDAPGDVALRLAPSLPPLVTDGERLRTALVNVLTNARQAVIATAGSGPGAARTGELHESSVVVTTARDPDGVLISVADCGTGIAAQDQPHVFDAYYTTRRAGTGLGLAITKNIIEGLGGSIALVGRDDVGAEVRIRLPLVAPGARA